MFQGVQDVRYKALSLLALIKKSETVNHFSAAATTTATTENSFFGTDYSAYARSLRNM